MTLKEILTLACINFFNDSKYLVHLKALFNGIEEDPHEFLHVLLLKALAVVPLETASQLVGHREVGLRALQGGKELLQLVDDAVLFGRVDVLIIPIKSLCSRERNESYLHL